MNVKSVIINKAASMLACLFKFIFIEIRYESATQDANIKDWIIDTRNALFGQAFIKRSKKKGYPGSRLAVGY